MIAMFMTIPKVAIYMQNAVLKRKRTFATNGLGLAEGQGIELQMFKLLTNAK